MIGDIERLYSLGFAIHWLKPKSKMPLKAGWTSGPRESLESLRASYRKGFNVGVRLGTPSKLQDAYLMVIDCDVKSESPRHRVEMEKRLEELYPGLKEQAPFVATGRGNGSAHYYVKTQTPFNGMRLSQSSESVKVKMPSATEPSKKERESLTPKELESGIRIRPAWEISLMGDGRQVVLPPSLHPDTGAVYAWGKAVHSVLDVPLISVEDSAPVKTLSVRHGASDKGFEPVEVELLSLDLPPAVIDAVLTGEGVEDRSAYLFTACLHMVRAGLKDAEILTLLTDKDHYLGECAYEHAKTESRARAAQWVDKYSLRKARQEADASFQFEEEVSVTLLDDEEAKVQAEELASFRDWEDRLERSKDLRLKVTLQNVDLILSNTFPGLFKRNLFSMRDFYGVNTPWGGRAGAELRDEDAIKVKFWLAQNYRIEPTVNIIIEAMTLIATRNAFHPVREYLGGLEWDGVPRVDTWLKSYLGATGPEPYLSSVSRKVLCAMVARVMVPGIKFDHVLIMEGRQGVGKSTAGRFLASEPWYCDTLPDVRDKDAMLNLQGAWVVEISELATLKRADSETYKAFFTRQTDRVRAPYGHRWQEYPRQSVFIGTTNAEDYLKDKTGNRRFWPVRVEACDFEGLKQDRDQLFAEALFLWEACGEPLYLEGEARKQAEEVAETRVAEDEEGTMRSKLQDFVDEEMTKPESERFPFSHFRIEQLFEGGPGAPFESYKADNWRLQMAANALRAEGFEKYRLKGRFRWRKIIKK